MRRLALIVVLLGGWLAVPSSASTYYDYWGYWHKPPGATAWEYSKVGPSGYYLNPGTQVEGWRYAIGTASQNDPKPRPVDASFGNYCHGITGTYQVLLVVDYGTQSGAPKGPVYSCYGFSGDAPNGLQVLTKQHTERDSGGLICAIDSYPKTGCGDVVSSPAPKPTNTTTPKPPAPTQSATATNRTTTAPPAPDATGGHTASPVATATQHATSKPTDDVSAMPPSPDPDSSSPAIVAKKFAPPHGRGGVPFGFIAACVFVVALAGAVIWQRRRRAG